MISHQYCCSALPHINSQLHIKEISFIQLLIQNKFLENLEMIKQILVDQNIIFFVFGMNKSSVGYDNKRIFFERSFQFQKNITKNLFIFQITKKIIQIQDQMKNVYYNHYVYLPCTFQKVISHEKFWFFLQTMCMCMYINLTIFPYCILMN